MIEGGNFFDVFGINYFLICGVYDFFVLEEIKRKRCCFKFGLKVLVVLNLKDYNFEDKLMIISIKKLKK